MISVYISLVQFEIFPQALHSDVAMTSEPIDIMNCDAMDTLQSEDSDVLWPRLTRLIHNLKKKLPIFQTRSLQSLWRSWLTWTRMKAMSGMGPGAHVVFHSWPRWKQQIQHFIKQRWASMRSRLLAYLTTSTSSPNRLAVRLTCPSMIMVARNKSCFL